LSVFEVLNRVIVGYVKLKILLVSTVQVRAPQYVNPSAGVL